ncbi:NACHT, LRR and PYD domains-containing protein 6-like [Lytechinus variegatus]|uniref:NACHT, LRR and PYD domains-containing protein 6-like n=1 Tax=Lytechinus variegatus TaxID=7654 RepID=UPI001BB2AF7B|nr:NACHT, LRR and PYD domains-containing protein 6-like [Lytechinus variegatus]
MATQGGINDDLLSKLAEEIETGEQMEALGRSLGFKPAAINRYTETNSLEGRVTCKGTREMLFDWRQTVEPSRQHHRLKQALLDAHLVMLAKTHLEGAFSTPDIFDKKISESLTVGKCREKLRHRYLDKLCKIQLKPWNKSDYAELKDLHTVVTMMRKDSSGRDTRKKEKLEGSVDEIFSTKVNGRLPSRILISAPAGVGKTTAVAKIAYDWAQEEKESTLEQLPLLFVLKFRNTSHKTSIGEAIKSQLLSDVDDLSPEEIESFIRRNQGICHIILDGLDEFAGIYSSNNIVAVIRCEEFPQSRVLVTTRPHLESYFNQDDLPRVYTKMWIEGFSMESSKEYIDRFFKVNLSDEKGEQLKEYLNDQPLIDELAKTPIFCLMICHLWSEDQLGSDVSTQTDLFDSVNKFLMHHANTRSTTSRLTFTHKNLNRIVKEIGRVALYGLLDDAKKLIFTLRDFRKIPHILDKACELGIISKTTVPITNLPQSDETTSTQIEFYHKLAQEHSAGKFIASETRVLLLRLRVSKLDRILWNINSNIGDYEELIRFAAGTNRHLGIRIMEALLANEHLEENERYRILLDCSSESKDSGGDMSSFVQRCVTAQSIILKSPTIYTVVGLQNLPKRLQREVRTMRFVESVLTADVTRRMWSCLTLFPNLHTISITDSSLSFPSSPPELPSVTRLLAERMTPSCYTSVLLSLPHARELDVSIVIENTSNTFEMKTDTNRMNQIVHRPHDLHTINVTLQQCVSQSLGEVNLGLKSGGLALLFGEQSRNQHLLSASGDMGRYGEILVDLFVKTTQLTFLNSM